ncbi:hypothetical protein [Fusobacterium sp.]|uniref:hypothetical protein n=1 Tax=Fusobacterium sp. TaxID=68766 RepID=UPI0025C4EB9A|nr:hypothetical protein [Fusobacterium sp.]
MGIGVEKRESKFQEILKELEYIKYTLNGLMTWDNLINLPNGAIEYRKRVMNYFVQDYYKKICSIEFRRGFQKLENKVEKTDVERAILRNIKKEYEYMQKIPVEEYGRYVELLTEVEEEWKKARELDDYSKVRASLKEVFTFLANFARYRGEESRIYENLVEYYAENITLEKIENAIAEIKKYLLPILQSTELIDEEGLSMNVQDENRQLELSKELMSLLGFDFNFGRVDVGEYPTTLSNSPDDVRVITSFTDNLLTGIYNTLHECGKGLYEQGIDKELIGSYLGEIPSQVLNEAIAKIYENRIGRDKKFSVILFEEIQKFFPEFKNIENEEFYSLINRVDKNPIRIEADELSYNFHIILRYELEKEIFQGKLEIEDLFKRSQEKYRKYLGIELTKEGHGILQDVHWVSGYVGFFPTYIMADIIAGQLINQFEKEEDKLEIIIEKREFFRLKDWLTDRVFKYGSLYSLEEILLKVTGEEINPKYYIEYMTSKYKGLCSIKI